MATRLFELIHLPDAIGLGNIEKKSGPVLSGKEDCRRAPHASLKTLQNSKAPWEE